MVIPNESILALPTRSILEQDDRCYRFLNNSHALTGQFQPHLTIGKYYDSCQTQEKYIAAAIELRPPALIAGINSRSQSGWMIRMLVLKNKHSQSLNFFHKISGKYCVVICIQHIYFVNIGWPGQSNFILIIQGVFLYILTKIILNLLD